MRGRLVVFTVIAAALLGGAATASAQTAPSLGTAQSFAVLSGTASVTNTGPSSLSGDLGTSGVAGITGFPPGTRTGALHNGDSVVFVAGQPIGRPGTTNLMKLHRIGELH